MREKDKNQLHELLEKMCISSTPESEERFRKAMRDGFLNSPILPLLEDGIPEVILMKYPETGKTKFIVPDLPNFDFKDAEIRIMANREPFSLNQVFSTRLEISISQATSRMHRGGCPLCEAGHVPTKYPKEEVHSKMVLIGSGYGTLILSKIIPEIMAYDEITEPYFKDPKPTKPHNFKDRPSIPSKKRRWGK